MQPKSIKPRVNVHVGYEWAGPGSARDDTHWTQLRELIKRSSPTSVDVRPLRIRGTQGQDLLTTIRRRVAHADILVFDITSVKKGSFNFNVVLEVGMAIGCSHFRKNRVFILAGPGVKPGSDLAGILYLKYSLRGDRLVFVDEDGFKHGLAAAIRACAKDKRPA